MKRFLLTTAILMLGATAAPAQTAANVPATLPFTPPDPIHVTLSRQSVQAIGQGLMKLPYETSAPILVDLQNQINAADKAAADAAQAKAKEDADKVAAADKAKPAPKPTETPGKK